MVRPSYTCLTVDLLSFEDSLLWWGGGFRKGEFRVLCREAEKVVYYEGIVWASVANSTPRWSPWYSDLNDP